VSGISDDMRVLLASDDPAAKESTPLRSGVASAWTLYGSAWSWIKAPT
jgi:hypothetical protein